MDFRLIFLLIAAVGFSHATIHFLDKFEDESWEQRWVYSTSKGDQAGKFKLTSGKFYGDKEKDLGIQTMTDAKFYQLTAKIDPAFSNEGKPLVLQFSVKHEQSIDCGGGYIKLFPKGLDQEKMHGDSPYYVMFGPDICGPGTKKVHVIFGYKGKNLLTKKDIRCKDDEFTHLYTLIVKPDNTYEVRIDNEKVESGELEADWDFLAPQKIKDPEAKKPEDWDDRAKIDDADDKKPEGYDKPELIPDPDAKKPEDWDNDDDGEWEPPMINNPEFKGEWKPKQIDNPAYKGEWVHPEIDNPDYKADAQLYKYDDIGAVGFEIWQVKSGTIFDNILVTDDIAEAEQVLKETFEVTKDPEKKMKDKLDEDERNRQEQEEKKRKEEEDSKKTDEKDKDEKDDDEEDDESDDKEKKEGGETKPPVVEIKDDTKDDDTKDDDTKDDDTKDEETKEETKEEETKEEPQEVKEEEKTTEEDKTEEDKTEEEQTEEKHDEL